MLKITAGPEHKWSKNKEKSSEQSKGLQMKEPNF